MTDPIRMIFPLIDTNYFLHFDMANNLGRESVMQPRQIAPLCQIGALSPGCTGVYRNLHN